MPKELGGMRPLNRRIRMVSLCNRDALGFLFISAQKVVDANLQRMLEAAAGAGVVVCWRMQMQIIPMGVVMAMMTTTKPALENQVEFPMLVLHSTLRTTSE